LGFWFGFIVIVMVATCSHFRACSSSSSSFFICSASTALPPFRGFVLLSFCTRLSLACDYIIEHLLYNVKHNSADFQHFPAFFHIKKAARRRCRAVFSFFPEQVVDRGAEGGRQIVQLVVSDDSAAVLDAADDLLRDVQSDDLELVGELFL
jgi:hypothetical protein